MPTPHVDPNETLYRQIGPGGNPIYFDPAQEPPVHSSAFLPSRSDKDGLSLIRSRLRTEVWSAYRAEKPDVRFRLAILRVSQLRQVATNTGMNGLTFERSPDGLDWIHGEPWAHCVALEINRNDYDAIPEVRRQIKQWALDVAKLLTTSNVVGPFDEPTSKDVYRPTPSEC